MSIGPTTRVALHLLQVGRCRHPEWVTLRGGGLGPVDFPALVALILHPTAGPILYDTGYAERFETATEPFPERFYRWLTPPHLPPAERLLTQLAGLGIEAGDIGRVLVSHLHADHVAGLRDLPSARFAALQADVAAGLGKTTWQALRRGVIPRLLPDDFSTRLDLVDSRPVVDLGAAWAPFRRGYDLIGDGSLIGVPLPGHAPAQLGVWLRTTDDRDVLLAADACWSARGMREQRLPSRLAGLVFDDWTRYCATFVGLGAVAARQPSLAIVPSHCAATLAAWRAGNGHAPR